MIWPNFRPQLPPLAAPACALQSAAEASTKLHAAEARAVTVQNQLTAAQAKAQAHEKELATAKAELAKVGGQGTQCVPLRLVKALSRPVLPSIRDVSTYLRNGLQ